MSKKRTVLNTRRLTKRQVAEFVSAGAVPRPDLEAAWIDAEIGLRPPRIYELGNGQILRVFNDADSGVGGKGDIYTLEDFQRFLEWAVRVRQDATAGRNSSVSHWWFYSKLRRDIPEHVPRLLQDLSTILVGSPGALEMSYAGLDVASQYIERVGFERARQETYDHLVAYVGEVIRARTGGAWDVDLSRTKRYPFISAPKHGAIMPINVVWSELSGLHPADLRYEAANEVRRARANYF